MNIYKQLNCFFFISFLVLSGIDLHAQDIDVPSDYTLIEDISYIDNDISGTPPDEYMKERCRLDIYYPQTNSAYASVVWFHGGGLVGGNRYMPDRLRNQGFAVIPVSYRLHPKVHCPAYIEDAAMAVAWVFKNIEKYGGDPNHIFVAGHSAGGYLASMIGLDRSWLKTHGIDADMIAGLIPFSGHAITHFTVRAERGIERNQPIVDEYAPLFHVRADAPPLVLITGDRELEMLGRYEENAYLWRMMKETGHKNTLLYELDGFDHGGMAVPAFDLLSKFVIKKSKDLRAEK